MIDSWGIPITLDDEMGVLLESVSPNDAILMWPVNILGQRESEGVDLHITLNWGKWDKSGEELSRAVLKALSGQTTALPRISEWASAEFKGREKTFKVFTLHQIKSSVLSMRKLVAPVFPDAFGDAYTPHISMSDELWNEIVVGKLTPAEANLQVGSLELRLGDAVLEVFS